jgi:cysteinyl-tRNA synthetase
LQLAFGLLGELCAVLGIAQSGEEEDLEAEIEALIQKRQEARKARDFKTADRIRDELKERGIVLEDTPAGVKWRREEGQ